MTEGIWYYGETGCGKSEKAFENYNPSTHYKYTEEWWDGYTGQDTLIIDELRGDTLRFREILALVDKHPHYVKRRCREPIPFLAKQVIITSALHPKDIFTNLNADDKLDQLYRRFKIIKLEIPQKSSEGNTEPLSDLESNDEYIDNYYIIAHYTHASLSAFRQWRSCVLKQVKCRSGREIKGLSQNDKR